jgi:polar amino acid transport system substrate-binding protein
MRSSHRALIALLPVFLIVSACGRTTPKPARAMSGELNALLPDDIREAGVIKAGGPVTQIPAVFLMQDAVTHTGYMIDLANAVGDLLGVEFEFTEMPFTALIPGLQRGVIDMTLVISDKKSHHEILDFVSYRRDGLGILVAAGNPNGFDSLESLCGHTVAVLSGSIAEGVLTEVNKSCADSMEIKVFHGISYAQLAVRSGQAEATFGGETALKYLSANAEGGTVFEVAPGGPYTDQPDAIAFLKGNDELRDAVQAALQQLVDNGTAATILEKYGADSSGLYDPIPINVAK